MLPPEFPKCIFTFPTILLLSGLNKPVVAFWLNHNRMIRKESVSRNKEGNSSIMYHCFDENMLTQFSFNILYVISTVRKANKSVEIGDPDFLVCPINSYIYIRFVSLESIMQTTEHKANIINPEEIHYKYKLNANILLVQNHCLNDTSVVTSITKPTICIK